MNVIQQAASLLEKTQNDLMELLSSSEFRYRQAEFKNFFRQMLARLEFMGATLSDTGQKKDLFPPVTNFMGEEIVEEKKVTAAELVNAPDAKEQFLKQRDDLYDLILSFTPQQVLNSYRLPEHQLVVRSVAKKAKVPEYADRAFNAAFIEDIQSAVAKNKCVEVKQQAIDDELNKQQKSPATDKPQIDPLKELGDLELTEEQKQIIVDYYSSPQITVEGQFTDEQKKAIALVLAAETKLEEDHLKTETAENVSTDEINSTRPEIEEKVIEETDSQSEEQKTEQAGFLTAEDIANDPELKKMGAKPGMEVYTTSKNKRAVRWPK